MLAFLASGQKCHSGRKGVEVAEQTGADYSGGSRGVSEVSIETPFGGLHTTTAALVNSNSGLHRNPLTLFQPTG